MSKKPDTTVRVDAATAPRLAALAGQHSLSQKDLIDAMVSYFERTGIDPQASPKGQGVADKLDRLEKRMETIIGFIREQEKGLLKPMRDELRVLAEQKPATRNALLYVVAEGIKPEFLDPGFVAAFKGKVELK